MGLYYFHLKDGVTILDNEGTDLPDLAEVRRTALSIATEILGGMKAGRAFWSGEPWKLWVTDESDGGGNRVLTLQFAAVEGEMLIEKRSPPLVATPPLT